MTGASVSGAARPTSPQRILVVGLSGSGKSTFARTVAEALELPCVELDSLYWEPNWVDADPEVFRSRVAEATKGDRWAVCGNYWSKLGPYLWGRADTVIWLDLPLWLVEVRSVRRTVWRALSRAELWSGNRERIRHLWASDALWRYNLQSCRRLRARYSQAMDDPQWSHITFYRLRSRREVRDWVRAISDGEEPRSEGGGRASPPGARSGPTTGT